MRMRWRDIKIYWRRFKKIKMAEKFEDNEGL
ncbi:MAG: hypothetical protein C5S38_05055 [Candidatus Methanophagaceae archaeon]|nr:MAG: hypothetical protein C5S38_05055 [Methanophagales archaeon]